MASTVPRDRASMISAVGMVKGEAPSSCMAMVVTRPEVRILNPLKSATVATAFLAQIPSRASEGISAIFTRPFSP